jgi:hypothetical protein
LEATRLRGRTRNRWQDVVREDGRQVGGKGWKEKIHNREKWKQLLRMARNLRILHMQMELINKTHIKHLFKFRFSNVFYKVNVCIIQKN